MSRNDIVEVECSQKDFEEIHRIIESKRSNAKFIPIPRKILVALLVDHSTIIGRLNTCGIQIKDVNTS